MSVGGDREGDLQLIYIYVSILPLCEKETAEATVAYQGPSSSRSAFGRAASADDISANDVVDNACSTKTVAIPILALRPGDSPRLDGEDKAHIAWLAETEASLPPILVDRRTMRVIDGMHRLLAASMRGREAIDVEFFEGTSADAFLRAVKANVTHGLPLSQADRRAAAIRIVASHPHMSDRSIGESVGLAARTVASIRRRSGEDVPQLGARMGRDGKIRPLDSAAGRRRAAELLSERPRASLREVAKEAGISAATVGDVRKRLQRGEEPIPLRAQTDVADRGASTAKIERPRPQEAAGPARVLEKLVRDPSLRHNQQGRRLLQLLQHSAMSAQDWSCLAAAVPPHCSILVGQLARHYAQLWQEFAQSLDKRAKVTDPWR